MRTVSEQNDRELYIRAAPLIAETIGRCCQAHGRCVIGVVGGRSIPVLLDRMLPYASELKGHIEVFWLDERVDEEKNYAAALPYLEQLREHGIDITWHPLLSTHKEAVLPEAQRVLAELDEAAGARALDLVIVSAGEDGHVASLFPRSPVLACNAATYLLVEDSPKPPPVRVTMTPPLLLSARHAFLFIVGEKKDVYMAFLDKNVTARDCPAKLLARVPDLTLLVSVR